MPSACDAKNMGSSALTPDGYLVPNSERGENMSPIEAIYLTADGQESPTGNPENQRFAKATPKLTTCVESPS